MILKESTVLQGRYVIQRPLGKIGPLDITYQAVDDEQDVIIREYFPVAEIEERGEDGLCIAHEPEQFAYGLAEYELEGDLLLRLQHPNVVPCTAQFLENNTVYRVSNRVMGISLRAYIRQRGGKISEEEAVELIKPILDALEAGHQLGLIHGALSPTTVFLERAKKPVLFNFQAARLFTAQLCGKVKEVRVQGYSPPEIRSERHDLGPWSDAYSIASLLYFMTMGRALPSVIYPSHHERLGKAIGRAQELSAEFKEVLVRALSMDYGERPQTIAALRGMFVGALVPVQDQSKKIDAGHTKSTEDFSGDGGLGSGLMDWEKDEEIKDITLDTRGNSLTMDELSDEQRMPAAIAPLREDAHLTLEKVNKNKAGNDEELQARLLKLENRQRAFNRVISTAFLLVFTAGAALYFGPDILDRFSTSAVAETESVQTADSPVSTTSPQEQSTSSNAPAEPTLSSVDSQAGPAAALAAVTEERDISEANPVSPQQPPVVQPVAVEPATNIEAAVQPASTRVVQIDRARAEREALALENERQYQYLRGQGDVLFGQEQWEEALVAYTAALEFRPGDAYLNDRMQIATDSVNVVTTDVELAFEKERQFQYFRGQGDVLFQEQRWEEAIVAYTSALEFLPDDEYVADRMTIATDSVNALLIATQQKSDLDKLIARVTDADGIFVVPTTPARLLEEEATRALVEYPSRARRANVEGRVIVRMIIDEEGNVQNPAVVEGIGFGCDEEVIRVLREAKFEPATFRDASVKSWYMFSLVFSLQ